MSVSRSRFILCVAFALAAHAALLGWMAGADRSSSESLLRVTRAAVASAAPRDPSIAATHDQRGDDAYSQRPRSGGSVTTSGQPADRGSTPTLTRFVMVASRARTPDGADTNPVVPSDSRVSQPTSPEKIMDAAHSPRAAYLAAWQADIEARGSRQYPSALLAGGQPRRLTMAVRLNPDGTLQAVRVLRSSGSEALDRAALAIVRDAAPFSSFDAELGDADGELGFIYDWLFQPGGNARLRAAS